MNTWPLWPWIRDRPRAAVLNTWCTGCGTITGLTTCQARSENKLDFHFNTALTAVNLAKHDWITSKYGTSNHSLWLITKPYTTTP